MDPDLDEAQKYPEGVDYPGRVGALPLGEFSGPEGSMNHLRAVPNRDS